MSKDDKIVDGIDLETGEIVDLEVVAPAPEGVIIEEIDTNPALEERAKLLGYIWPRNMTSFDSDRTGYLTDNAMNWHANIKMPVSLKFRFERKKLFIYTAARPHVNINIDLSSIMDVDKLKTDVAVIQVKDGPKKFRATQSFRKRINELAYDLINSLQHKIYKIVMITKVDVQVYSRLDSKVLLGESLVETLTEKHPTHVVTNKDGEKIIYFYQSVLEEKSVKELADLVK